MNADWSPVLIVAPALREKPVLVPAVAVFAALIAPLKSATLKVLSLTVAVASDSNELVENSDLHIIYKGFKFVIPELIFHRKIWQNKDNNYWENGKLDHKRERLEKKDKKGRKKKSRSETKERKKLKEKKK